MMSEQVSNLVGAISGDGEVEDSGTYRTPARERPLKRPEGQDPELERRNWSWVVQESVFHRSGDEGDGEDRVHIRRSYCLSERTCSFRLVRPSH